MWIFFECQKIDQMKDLLANMVRVQIDCELARLDFPTLFQLFYLLILPLLHLLLMLHLQYVEIDRKLNGFPRKSRHSCLQKTLKHLQSTFTE